MPSRYQEDLPDKAKIIIEEDGVENHPQTPANKGTITTTTSSPQLQIKPKISLPGRNLGTANAENRYADNPVVTPQKKKLPPWLIPGTYDWNKQVERNGLAEMMERRQQALTGK